MAISPTLKALLKVVEGTILGESDVIRKMRTTSSSLGLVRWLQC